MKGPILGTYLSRLLILAILGYVLDLGCILSPVACDDDGSCCISCALPAHRVDADHSFHGKAGLALLPSTSTTLDVNAEATGEVSFRDFDEHPRVIRPRLRDPVRGPPSNFAL
jgi:hypothetical protein